MAHGLEARVPFLSRDMLAVAQRIPIEWKLLGEDGQEKRLLREAFSGWIPEPKTPKPRNLKSLIKVKELEIIAYINNEILSLNMNRISDN